MDKNILIIVNPNAGKGRVQKKIHKIASNFSKQNYLVDIMYTKRNYSAKDIIKDYKGNYGYFNELSSVHIENSEYSLSLSDKYIDYLLNVAEMEVPN